MSDKILVTSQGIELNDNGVLMGEIRSDVEVDMQGLNFQVAIFDTNAAKRKKNQIIKDISKFYYKDFYDSLKKTKWEFLKPPKIALMGVNDKKVKIHFPFDAKEDVIAMSLKDGDITDKIKVDGSVDIDVLGNNLLTYNVSDTDGNEIKIKRLITVRTNEKPKIIGANDTTITIGADFNPMTGVTATDKEDGDITNLIKISGKVNNKQVGSYNLTYSVTDSDDNTVDVKRVVNIIDNINPSEDLRLSVVNSARKLIGKPYVWGGNYIPLGNSNGTDCSGLMQWSYHDNGITLSRTTYTQINEGFEVKENELKPGDLIFMHFTAPNTPQHVFMYSGEKDGQHMCIEAPRTGLNIRERAFTWGSDYRARRIIKDSPVVSGTVGDKASPNIIYYVKGIEGYAPYVYRDSVGVRTLGYGMTGNELNGANIPLSESSATHHLVDNFNKLYYLPVLNMLKARGATNMLQREVDALASFAYNCGLGSNGLGGSQLLKKYVAGERGESIHNEFKKWVHGGGQVLPGLVRRREEEWKIFSGSSDKVGGYNCPPEISFIGTNGLPTGRIVTDNGGYGARPY
ncbi:immunoglobulin-like domain-containing protein [Clostridium perfringens]|uniref:immunoglobulin-like domain-containing protein n=1 Tax=Clostridium perfringens TaxID=1502 RepID=UPI001FD7E4EB|nr:immunoglobulin-like domain-containing protein [Clostridium perfringens]